MIFIPLNVMFVRCKKNKSGSTSVQIIDKSTGKYILYQTVGSSNDSIEIEFLISKAKNIIKTLGGQSLIPFDRDKELIFVDTFINSLDAMELVGPELLLGQIFDDIGFNAVEDDLFRHLVITRLIYPVSKLKTTDYLFKYKGIELSVYSIYRYLDKLHSKQIEKVKEISLQHTLQLLGNNLSVVFYDVTTLYFEASNEDDLRKTGFSKDGKHQHPHRVVAAQEAGQVAAQWRLWHLFERWRGLRRSQTPPRARPTCSSPRPGAAGRPRSSPAARRRR